MSLLEISGLRIALNGDADQQVVKGLDLSIEPGQTMCLVGESGSGKSLTALATMGLLPSALKIIDGSIRLQGEELTTARPSRMRNLRATVMSMIFQEPMTALNPVARVGQQIEEVLEFHSDLSQSRRKSRVKEMMEAVHLPDVDKMYRSFPHQLSGGQRQRIMIAMALVMRPQLLIADEPTTALDVTVQAQIFDLLNEIQRDFGAAIILITHDMGAISEMADRVAVMYAGRVIEEAGADQVLDFPQHPYTRGLIACIPALGRADHRLEEIPGVVPPLHLLGAGCAFAERCAYRAERCDREKPLLAAHGHHPVACHGVEEGRL